MTFKAPLFALGLLAASTAIAHQGATGIVRERMDMMSDIAESVKTLSLMLRGQTEYQADTAQAAFLQISDHASMLPAMFPEGSDAAPSEAAPTIWTEPDGFAAIFEELANAAQTGAGAVHDPAALAPAFGAVAKTCKTCHESYRISH